MRKEAYGPIPLEQLIRDLQQSRESQRAIQRAADEETLDLLQYENSKRRDRLIKGHLRDMARKERRFQAAKRAALMSR